MLQLSGSIGMHEKAKRRLFVLHLLLVVFTLGGVFAARAAPAGVRRTLYAVNQAPGSRGSISVYDIDTGHSLLKKIQAVANVRDLRGVAASAVTGRLFVAYEDTSRRGRVACLDLYTDKIVWNSVIAPGVDRLAISANGRWLYVPTSEYNAADFINIVDASTGSVLRRVHFSSHSHDTQYPLSGPIFQETKAEDGTGRYLYLIDPHAYKVSSIGPFSGVVGPFAVDASSTYAVADVTDLWGMQVADLKTHGLVTAMIPDHPSGKPGLLHGIGWTPDEKEVWQSGFDSHVYIWDMRHPMAPALKKILSLRSGPPHWLTFTIKGDYAYVSSVKNSRNRTEIFDARTYASVGAIGSSEDMLEVDFVNGRISQVGDQFGIGRR